MSLKTRIEKLEKMPMFRDDVSRKILVVYPPLQQVEIERGVKRKTGARWELKSRLKKNAKFRLVG